MTTPRSEVALSEQVAELRETVERLAQLVQVLTSAVDGLTDELQWQNNHVRDADHSPLPPPVLHSMPADPTAEDWKLNRVRPDPPSPPSPSSSSADDKTLFD